MADDPSTTTATEDATPPADQNGSTPPDLGDAGKQAIQAERLKARDATKANADLKKANADLAAKLQALEDRDKTETQKLADQKAAAEKSAADAQAAVVAAQTQLLKYRVAAAKQLPPELAERLQGSTEEELTADAAKLLKLVGPQGPPNFDGGVRKTAKSNDMNQVIRRAAGLA